jgi:hypothetical protein
VYLIPLALPIATYLVGRAQGAKRPTVNHAHMARWIDRQVQRDELIASLSHEDRAEAEALLHRYYDLPERPGESDR